MKDRKERKPGKEGRQKKKKKKKQPTSKRLFCLVSESIFLEKNSLALGLEYVIANSLRLYPKGTLGQGYSQLGSTESGRAGEETTP